VSVHDFDGDAPSVHFVHGGRRVELRCEVIAGCDGFHGICREAVADRVRIFSREYPYGWLGVLAAVAPRARSSYTPVTNEASPCSACARAVEPPLHPVLA